MLQVFTSSGSVGFHHMSLSPAARGCACAVGSARSDTHTSATVKGLNKVMILYKN